MSRRLDQLLAGGSDADLAYAVFAAIFDYHGKTLTANALCPEEQVVYFVSGANGMIANGGFENFFGIDLADDPQFERTAAAFAAIGCIPAAAVFRRALALFPDGTPPADVRERLELYRGADEA